VGEQSDKAFIKTFGGILVGLTLLTIAIIFLSNTLDFGLMPGDNPSQDVLAEERIQPVADVYTGETGAEALVHEVAEEEAAIVNAFDGSVDGEMIYANVCAVCHAAGVAGAPQPGSAEMAERTGKGMDAVLEVAINGLNAMPARGGRLDLSDEQMRAVVEFMLQ